MKPLPFIVGFVISLGLMLSGCEAPEAAEKANRETRADSFLETCVEAAGNREDFAGSLRECERIANSIRRENRNVP